MNSRCFYWFPAAINVSLSRTQLWRFHTELSKFVWNILKDNLGTKNHIGLRLGKRDKVLISYNITNYWLFLFNGFDFKFRCVTVKTSNTHNLVKGLKLQTARHTRCSVSTWATSYLNHPSREQAHGFNKCYWTSKVTRAKIAKHRANIATTRMLWPLSSRENGGELDHSFSSSLICGTSPATQCWDQ